MSDNHINFPIFEHKSEIQYIDLDKLEYEEDVLLFLRKKLDEFAIECFRKVKDHHRGTGLHKTKIESYADHRKRYDAAFLTLEVQGFIEQRTNGNSRPFYLTVRGFQLAHLLKAEKENGKYERL